MDLVFPLLEGGLAQVFHGLSWLFHKATLSELPANFWRTKCPTRSQSRFRSWGQGWSLGPQHHLIYCQCSKPPCIASHDRPPWPARKFDKRRHLRISCRWNCCIPYSVRAVAPVKRLVPKAATVVTFVVPKSAPLPYRALESVSATLVCNAERLAFCIMRYAALW